MGIIEYIESVKTYSKEDKMWWLVAIVMLIVGFTNLGILIYKVSNGDYNDSKNP